MSIGESMDDWNRVELKAQTHELSHVETPKLPATTTAQQLLWVTTDLAKAKVSAACKDRAISEAMMYLSIGATDRAKEVLNRAILDL